MTFFKKHQSKTFKNLYRHSRWLKWLEKSHCTLHLQLYSWKKSLGNICRLWFITESMFIDQKSPVLLCFIFNYVYGWFKYTGGKKWSCVYLAPYCEKLRIFERREACHAEQRALTFEISHRREETEGKGRPWDCLRLMFRTAGWSPTQHRKKLVSVELSRNADDMLSAKVSSQLFYLD